MSTLPVTLVVEDEALIRLSVAWSLRDLGWEVIEASNAAKALDAMGQREEISVLVTDIDMPGEMNGIGLARTVSERWPVVTIMITSGMTQPATGELPVGARFIAKPYVPEVLSEDLYACLRT